MKKMFFTAVALVAFSTMDARRKDPIGVHDSGSPTPCEAAWNSAYDSAGGLGLSDADSTTIADSAYNGCIAAGGN